MKQFTREQLALIAQSALSAAGTAANNAAKYRERDEDMADGFSQVSEKYYDIYETAVNLQRPFAIRGDS